MKSHPILYIGRYIKPNITYNIHIRWIYHAGWLWVCTSNATTKSSCTHSYFHSHSWRRHFQVQFLEITLVYFELCASQSKWEQVTLGSGNYLVPARHQWWPSSLIYSCVPRPNELMQRIPFSTVPAERNRASNYVSITTVTTSISPFKLRLIGGLNSFQFLYMRIAQVFSYQAYD